MSQNAKLVAVIMSISKNAVRLTQTLAPLKEAAANLSRMVAKQDVFAIKATQEILLTEIAYNQHNVQLILALGAALVKNP
jgi:hypothetical protein